MKRAPFLSPAIAVVLSLLFITTPVATAQPAVTTLPGITVLGMGQVSVPAETATIVLMLGSGAYYKDPAMMEEQPAATPASSPEVMTEPVIAALVAAGVPETDIELISNPFTGDYGPYGGPALVTLVFTLQDPDAEQISTILMAGIDAATAGGMYVNMTSALYGVADCATLEREARAAAIADARDKATVQAELLDVSLGDVVASRDDVYGAVTYGGVYGGIMQNNTCTLRGGFDSMSILYSAPTFDPGVEPSVTVSAYVELTFEISPAT